MKGFKKMAIYEVYDGDKRLDCDIIDVLAKKYKTTANCIRSTMWHGCKLQGIFTFKKTGLYVLYMRMADCDVIPYSPKHNIKKEEKEEPYFDVIVRLLKDRRENRVALPDGEKNPAQYLPKLYELGFDCKINTYIDPSVRTTHRKPKEYYSIEVVRYV